MNRPLTVTLHIGGKQIDSLTSEQREKMAERLTETIGLYYSRNLDEFKKIKK